MWVSDIIRIIFSSTALEATHKMDSNDVKREFQKNYTRQHNVGKTG
jgi:hypothetical protein